MSTTKHPKQYRLPRRRKKIVRKVLAHDGIFTLTAQELRYFIRATTMLRLSIRPDMGERTYPGPRKAYMHVAMGDTTLARRDRRRRRVCQDIEHGRTMDDATGRRHNWKDR